MAGIYLHIPFCKQACLYCNFHFSTSMRSRNDFVMALLKEMTLRKEYLNGEPVETVYLGGGTPSLLMPGELERIIEKLFLEFTIDKNIELTLEANPDDISHASLADWKKNGINRLSIGVQSFFQEELSWMNRAHDAGQALNAVRLAQDSGFSNISIDLIYGSPFPDEGRWEKNIARAISLNIPHLSCYALTVEPKTALQSRIWEKKMPPVDPDRQAGQFFLLMERLEKAGYEHYEISNLALPGRRSRHNSAYWHGKKYLGLGPSAHSFNGISRQWNIANNQLYIQALGKNTLPFEIEWLTPVQRLNEYIMTSIRTREGIDLSHVSENFGNSAAESILAGSGSYFQDLKLEQKNSRLVLTKEGKLFADGIASALFFEKNETLPFSGHVRQTGPSRT
jgi:oxygen-independent coproporphyrinogen-3 oxidase